MILVVMDRHASWSWWSGVNKRRPCWTTVLDDRANNSNETSMYVSIYCLLWFLQLLQLQLQSNLSCLFVPLNGPLAASTTSTRPLSRTFLTRPSNTSFPPSAAGTPHQQQQLQPERDPTMAIATCRSRHADNNTAIAKRISNANREIQQQQQLIA